MGNYKFRLSDMIPNAWFYKLKDMTKPRKHTPSAHKFPSQKNPFSTTSTKPPHFSHTRPRYAYNFTTSVQSTRTRDKHYNSPINQKASETHLPVPRRYSSKRRRSYKRKTIYKPSLSNHVFSKPSSIYSPNDLFSSMETSPEHKHGSLEYISPPDSQCNCRIGSSTADIIIDVNDPPFTRKSDDKLDGYHDVVSDAELELPPTLTRPSKFPIEPADQLFRPLSFKIVKQENIKKKEEEKKRMRKSCVRSTGLRIRANSPKIGAKKIQGVHARKSGDSVTKNRRVSESFAIVKSSVDPQRDFRESMLEMIIENNIRASMDLEDLLACYLSLNSDEYHGLIVKAFEQIWFDLAELRI